MSFIKNSFLIIILNLIAFYNFSFSQESYLIKKKIEADELKFTIEEKNIILTLQDKDLRKTIELQLKIRFKIDENKKLIDKISSKNFNKKQMNQFAQENNLTIEKIKINGIKDTKKFSEDLLIKIYNYNIGEIFVYQIILFKRIS